MRTVSKVWMWGCGLALGLLASSAGAEVPGHNPDLDHRCSEGFQWSRKIVACAQAECPAGASRTYDLVCNCGEAWDKPFKTCYDPKRPGFATHCVAAGQACSEPKPTKRPRSSARTRMPPPRRPARVVTAPAPPASPPVCEVFRAEYDPRAKTCECPDGLAERSDGLVCEAPPSSDLVDDFEVCTREDLEQTNAVYDGIGVRLASPDAAHARAHADAVGRIETKALPASLRGLAAPKPAASGATECAAFAKPIELDPPARRSIDALLSDLDRGRPPAWVRGIRPHAGLLTNVGAGTMDNAPPSVQGADDCVKAKYVYASALPVLEKQFGFKQIDGSSFVGGCGVFFSRRGFVRIANNVGFVPLDAIAQRINAARGRRHREITLSPEATLRLSKQGTCGEWAYGLAEVMRGAGLRASVITAYREHFGVLSNHAATVVECYRDGVVEQRVCDAWYLGHDNQQDNAMYWYGGFDGAADSVHACMPMSQWRARQAATGKRLAFNPQLPEPHNDWVSIRDLAVQSLRESIATWVPKLVGKRPPKNFDRAFVGNLSELLPAERDATYLALLREARAAAKNPGERKVVDDWIARVRRGAQQ